MSDLFQSEAMATEHDKNVLGTRNRGYLYSRTKHPSGDLEKAFADTWAERENGTLAVLQILFSSGGGIFTGFRMAHWVTPIERYVVATVIQWLGTNIGFCFLQECLRKCNYMVVEIPPLKPPKPPRPEPPNPYKRKIAV